MLTELLGHDVGPSVSCLRNASLALCDAEFFPQMVKPPVKFIGLGMVTRRERPPLIDMSVAVLVPGSGGDRRFATVTAHGIARPGRSVTRGCCDQVPAESLCGAVGVAAYRPFSAVNRYASVGMCRYVWP